MKNDLFNQNLMKKLSKDNKLHLTITKHDLIKKHLEKLENGDFKSETSNYLYFYEIILKEILGYDLQENILFDEKEDIGRGKSEFVLKNGDKKFMVVELKDQTSDLDKPQNRTNDKRTPVDQAFDYAQHTGDIDWILLSNYNEFRLYNWHTKGKYISFTVGDLLDKEVFSYFMLSFSYHSHINAGYVDELIQETILVEKKLEKNFYKLFHETRLMLLKEIEENNECSREDAIHYAQLILNRYMFICFAEDIENLLPSQLSTQTISKPIKDGDIGGTTLWNRLNELFKYIDVGNEFKGISKYNGGLFKDDLSSLNIRDLVDDQTFFKETWQKWDFEKDLEEIEELIGPHGAKINPIYKNLLVISSFDFSSELDVNILGHVFENSIGDIEELKADDRGRRKKDGVFYTPEYITDYICRNTIIPYLSLSGEANTVEELVKEYWGTNIDKLDVKLKNIKIVDPACGSGAFLNKAADVLVEIHVALHEEMYKENKSLDRYIDNIGKRREILLNNIYGVDLNEESVEITKLSLFLKVCKKGLSLPNLDDNIKCGNSLIDDPEFAGDKAFNWEEEFRPIFEDGGFDVVVGNPPYVKVQNIPHLEIDFYINNYYFAHDKIDISILFIELAHRILKKEGINCFITSNQFLKTEYGLKARKFILEKIRAKKIIDFGDLPVFEEASTYVSIFIFIKSKPKDFNYVKIPNLPINIEKVPSSDICLSELNYSPWALESYQIRKIFDKLKEFPQLNDGIGKCWYGIVTGSDPVLIFDDINDVEIEMEAFLPLIRAQDCSRYSYAKNSKFVIYPYKYINGETVLLTENEVKEKYPKLFSYLEENKEVLMNRKDSRKTLHDNIDWYKLIRFGQLDIFRREKIVFPGETKTNKFGIDLTGSGYSGARVFSVTSNNNEISLKYLLAIFNSTLIEKYLHSFTSLKRGGYHSYSSTAIDKVPICNINIHNQQPFVEKTDKMLELNKDLQNEINSFKEWLTDIFYVEKFSKKLEKYYELSPGEFLNELKKKKVDVKNRENFTYLKDGFLKSVSKIMPLLQEIKETDNAIDQMVYELYGFTEDEIKIIEDSLDK